MAAYIEYSQDLGMAQDEDLMPILSLSNYPTLSGFLFAFYLFDVISQTKITISNISIDLTAKTVIPFIQNADVANMNISKHHYWWLHQTDPTGFESDIYSGSFTLKPSGRPYNSLPSVTLQNIFATVYALRNYFGQSASEEFVTTDPEIDWNNGQTQTLQLASGSNTITFINPMSGVKACLRIKQPATGYGTISLPVTCHWLNNNILTTSTGSTKFDIITLIYYASDDIYAISYANY